VQPVYAKQFFHYRIPNSSAQLSNQTKLTKQTKQRLNHAKASEEITYINSGLLLFFPVLYHLFFLGEIALSLNYTGKGLCSSPPEHGFRFVFGRRFFSEKVVRHRTGLLWPQAARVQEASGQCSQT